jgi:large subunit ribosomal protein L5
VADKKKKVEAAEAPAAEKVTPRLKIKYSEEAVPALKEKFGYANPMQIPRLEKIIINMGLGAEKDNPKGIEAAAKELGQIAGQKPVITKAKKSVANFKVREGMNIGAKVTLRNDRMYFFADKFMNIVLPRVRDFRGVSAKSFDGRGNYALGVREQLIFPEINYDDVDKVRGMNIVFVTSAKTDEEAKELLTLLGMPFEQA